LTRPVDFALGILNSVDIEKRAKALIRIAQQDHGKNDMVFAL
jgi:hypothetical protein